MPSKASWYLSNAKGLACIVLQPKAVRAVCRVLQQSVLCITETWQKHKLEQDCFDVLDVD